MTKQIILEEALAFKLVEKVKEWNQIPHAYAAKLGKLSFHITEGELTVRYYPKDIPFEGVVLGLYMDMHDERQVNELYNKIDKKHRETEEKSGTEEMKEGIRYVKNLLKNN